MLKHVIIMQASLAETVYEQLLVVALAVFTLLVLHAVMLLVLWRWRSVGLRRRALNLHDRI